MKYSYVSFFIENNHSALYKITEYVGFLTSSDSHAYPNLNVNKTVQTLYNNNSYVFIRRGLHINYMQILI